MRSISINNIFPLTPSRTLLTTSSLKPCNNAPIGFQAVANVIVITKTITVRTQNPKTKLGCFSLPLSPSLPPYNISSIIYSYIKLSSESSFKEEGVTHTVVSKYMLSPLRRENNVPSPPNSKSDKPSSNPQPRHHSQETILRQQRPQPHPLHISATPTSLTLTENRQTNHASQRLFKIKLALLSIKSN